MAPGSDLGSTGAPRLHTFVVAFALMLIKAKPASVTIQAFLKQLQNGLLNTSEHGGGLSTDAESVQELQTTIRRLEGELQHHTAEMDALKEQHQILQETLTLISDGELSAYVQSLVQPADTERLSVSPGQHRQDFATMLKNSCRPVLYHTMRVVCMSRDDATCDPSNLALHLTQLSSTIIELTKSIIATDRKDATSLYAVTTACTRSISILLAGWRTIIKRGAAIEHCREVECSIVHLFDQIVTLLETMPQQSLLHTKTTQSATRPSTRSTTRRKQRVEKDKTQEEERRMLAVILRHSLRTLQPNFEADSRLLDGFVSSIIAAVGRCLFKSAFGHGQCLSVEEDIRAVPAASFPAKGVESEEFTTPSLVYLLEEAIATTVSKNGITKATKKHLQEVLVSSIFRSDASKEIFDVPAARMQAADIPEPPSLEALSADQWFQQEVWRVIGWEILAA